MGATPTIVLPEEPLTDGAIVLRAWRRGDVPALTAACQDAEIVRWTAIPTPYETIHSLEWIRAQPQQRARGEAAQFAIVDPEETRLLGSISVHKLDWTNLIGEIGYWIAREERSRGVATRALLLISAWAFERLGIERLQLTTHPENVASQRVAEKAGFRREGLLRSYWVQRGRRVDLVLYSLLRSDLDSVLAC